MAAYFTKDFLDFFTKLAKNNSKEWFDKNKPVYEKTVKEPFKKLVEDLIENIRKHDKDLNTDAKESIFRINRDIRFSKDKTPYKTNVSANISKFGKRSPDHPGFYIQLGADVLLAGGGAYAPDKDQLKKIRDEILYAPKEFKKIIGNAGFVKKYKTVQGEQNKVIPAEYKELFKEQPLIANKQFYYMTELDPKTILKPDLMKILMDYYLAGRELNNFLMTAIS